MTRVFLTAQWRHLVMLNYAIDPHVLYPYVPRNTELDTWNGTTYVSLVGFRFLDTRLKRIAIPFHRHFEEINLRFYVRTETPDGIRRGVVFIREVVPRRAIAWIARWVYGENYVACPVRSDIDLADNGGASRITYDWKHEGSWLTIGATFAGDASLPVAGSEEEFITEHYWGYSALRDGRTVEYRVEHPQWRVWPGTGHVARGDFARFYGSAFADALSQQPTSSFIAQGSPVVVREGATMERGV